MTKYLYVPALIIGIAAATPAQAGWFSFGGIMGTGAGDTGFGTNQVAGSQNKQIKTSDKQAATDKNKSATFVKPTAKAKAQSASSQ